MTYPITTTLKKLRENHACFTGYNKLVCTLSGKEYSKHKTSYERFKHEKDIPLTCILESNGLDDALWALRASNASDRDMRLFAVWCARQVQHLMTDQRSLDALDVAERFANGKATQEELDAARVAAWTVAESATWDATWDATRAATRAAARDVAESATWAATRVAGYDANAVQKDMFIKMCNGVAPWQS